MDIVPIHYRVSEPVRKYFEIEDDAAQMMKMLDDKNFKGLHRAGYALAHCQVVPFPLAFFVLDQALVDDKSFESRVIINPKILRAPYYHDLTKAQKRLGMGPEHRRVNYKTYEEGCLSFPNRRGKRLNRFDRIKVTYQIKGGLWGLRRVTRWLEGLPSQVFQHEFDHCRGENIYFKGQK